MVLGILINADQFSGYGFKNSLLSPMFRDPRELHPAERSHREKAHQLSNRKNGQ